MKLNNLEIYERIYSSHWFLTSYHGIGFVFDFPRIGGGKFITQVLCIMENQMCRFIFDRDEFEKAANYTSDRLINDNKWRAKIYHKITYYTKRYFALGEKLLQLPLADLSDDKLVKFLRKIVRFQHYHLVFSVLANGVVLDGRNHLSNKIREELKRSLGTPKNFENYWTLLTQPTKMSLRQRKDYELAQLASLANKLPARQIKYRLERLRAKYCWLDYNNMGPAASFKQFERELGETKCHNKNSRLRQALNRLKQKQQALMGRLKFSPRLRFLVSLAQLVIWQKGYRKDVQYHGFYCYEKLFKELARRKRVADWQTLSFLFPWEVEKFIKRNQPRVSNLEQRRKFSVFIVSRKGLNVLVGQKAKDFVRRLGSLEDYSGMRELKGQCAYVGRVRGIVKIIQVPGDMTKMRKGDILVSQATSPDLLPAMKKAAAIVTSTGGLIAHAAITARELKIPCVVGTTNANIVLKDGDLVEVDATKGLVRILKKVK